MNKKDLVQELDSQVGSLLSRTSVMEDIEIELGRLNIEMQNTKEEHLWICFREWRKQVKILSELMHYVMGDINKDCGNLEGLTEKLFNKIVRDLDE